MVWETHESHPPYNQYAAQPTSMVCEWRKFHPPYNHVFRPKTWRDYQLFAAGGTRGKQRKPSYCRAPHTRTSNWVVMRGLQARDSDFSKWHQHTVLFLSAGVVLGYIIALWPLVWRGCELRVREQTYLLLLRLGSVVRKFSEKGAI